MNGVSVIGMAHNKAVALIKNTASIVVLVVTRYVAITADILLNIILFAWRNKLIYFQIHRFFLIADNTVIIDEFL